MLLLLYLPLKYMNTSVTHIFLPMILEKIKELERITVRKDPHRRKRIIEDAGKTKKASLLIHPNRKR